MSNSENLEKARRREGAPNVPEDESGMQRSKSEDDRHASQGKLQPSYDAQARERGGKQGDQARNVPEPDESSGRFNPVERRPGKNTGSSNLSEP